MRQLYVTYAETGAASTAWTNTASPRVSSGNCRPTLVEEIRPRLQVSRPVYMKRSASLDESPTPSMRMGTRVRHPKFGDGVVLNFRG